MSVLLLVGGLVLWGVVVRYCVLSDSAPRPHDLPHCVNDFDGGY